MKKQLIYLLAVTALATSCTKSDDNTSDGFGKIRMGCQIDATVGETRAASTPAPAISDLKIKIVGGETDSSWANLAAYKAEDPLFKAGTYTTSVSYGDPDTEGVDQSYYAGSQSVTVLARQTVNASITAKVAKSQAFVTATAQFLKYFSNAQFTLKTGSNNSFLYKPGTTTAGEVVWVKAGTKLTVTGTAQRQASIGGEEPQNVTFAEQSLAAASAATCHIFKFDAANAGSATLTITLDDGSTITEQVSVELNDNAVL